MITSFSLGVKSLFEVVVSLRYVVRSLGAVFNSLYAVNKFLHDVITSLCIAV